MFQTANTFKKSMSYNDYLTCASSPDEADLENGWGWFIDIDIEIAANKTLQIKKKDISISNISKSESDISKTESNTSSWIVHATCLISIVCIFIIM